MQMQNYLSVEKAAHGRLEPLNLSSRIYYLCPDFWISYCLSGILAQ